MKIDTTTDVCIKRTLEDEFSYRGIFNGAKETIELTAGIFAISLQFANTNYTSEDMYIRICVDFNEFCNDSTEWDVADFKEFAYANNNIEVRMTEKEHERLTGGRSGSRYLLPIYNSIISEALDFFCSK